MGIHGGDVYRNTVNIDFSTNVNPLGVPEAVTDALHRAVEICGRYPDMEAERLKHAASSMLGVPEEYLLFGNGASELFLALVHSIKPKKTVIPVPSFYGYEYAAKAAGSEIFYYTLPEPLYSEKDMGRRLREGYGWLLEDDVWAAKRLGAVLTEDTDLLFLANPNNPTGKLWSKEALQEILRHCKEKGIYVVLDECFIEFCGNAYSMLSEIHTAGHLVLIRAFTKIFSIPGVRLGYLVCKDRALLMRTANQLPEWNLSCFAQEAGCACAKQVDFILQTETYVKQERKFLEEGLRQKGMLVFPSQANFILVYSRQPLYGRLLEKGILIRDCANFRGLCQGFYRIAVKGRQENLRLLASIEIEIKTK